MDRRVKPGDDSGMCHPDSAFVAGDDRLRGPDLRLSRPAIHSRSLRLHAGGLDHGRPLLPLPGEEGGELLGRRDPGIDAELGQGGADLGRFQAFVDRGVELGRRSPRACRRAPPPR